MPSTCPAPPPVDTSAGDDGAPRVPLPASDEGLRMIPSAVLERDSPRLASMLGAWVQAPERLAAQFASSGAVPHVVIDDFFAEPMARALVATFPAPDAPLWHRYANPLERKKACSDTSRLPAAHREALFALCGPTLLELVRRIAGLGAEDMLQADPYCHGGGLHSHSTGDKLDLHLDYCRHPISGLERRFNLIVYLTSAESAWLPSYGGALELRGAADDDVLAPSESGVSVLPAFNRALLFSTTAPSFHGFPTPLTCPSDMQRNSLALYYLTPPRPDTPKRSKALYVPRPGEPHDSQMERLRAIRAERRLEESDLEAPALTDVAGPAKRSRFATEDGDCPAPGVPHKVQTWSQ